MILKSLSGFDRIEVLTYHGSRALRNLSADRTTVRACLPAACCLTAAAQPHCVFSTCDVTACLKHYSAHSVQARQVYML
eukprot:IDg20477t1